LRPGAHDDGTLRLDNLPFVRESQFEDAAVLGFYDHRPQSRIHAGLPSSPSRNAHVRLAHLLSLMYYYLSFFIFIWINFLVFAKFKKQVVLAREALKCGRTAARSSSCSG
jgi:hypothetical protein